MSDDAKKFTKVIVFDETDYKQGATHSQSIQSVFTHFPGIYVVMSSNPCIAKKSNA